MSEVDVAALRDLAERIVEARAEYRAKHPFSSMLGVDSADEREFIAELHPEKVAALLAEIEGLRERLARQDAVIQRKDHARDCHGRWWQNGALQPQLVGCDCAKAADLPPGTSE